MNDINLDKELAKKRFRVSVFGSARTKKGDGVYDQVYELGRRIGEKGYDVVTGGGPGNMQAANEGHQAGKKSPDVKSFGLPIKLPWENAPNKYLDSKRTYSKFSDRLDNFMILSNVVVMTPGGLGTCLELFYTWQLTQVKHICSMPILLCGEMWFKLYDWIKEEIIAKGRADEKDLKNIYLCKNIDEAMEIINKAYDVYQKEGENYCVNYKKYKLD